MTLVEDLRILGRMNYRQLGMILLAGLVVWWITSALITLLAHFVWDLWRSTEPESLGHAAMTAFYVSSLAEPVMTIVSVLAGLRIGYLTFSRFKKALV